ncbi:SDR family NAD(P)-dependent oxidoreductase [Aliarcobacter butzleri]|uniref:Short-chain dehydrogenase n=1 Tax=Aliarcobacter butzleri L352 TaxID=1447260 RepID=A0A837JA33_9BACT|nr:SDR family NAD(P)-dependent oxidoreductase [Aliarcobacter butzleri]KLE03689.1 hypothetical protein AF77_09525 [Aliarcobacter butzleri L352]MCG3717814.1 SDR family NAD(P)-dependent oxidoreductase [Aliarcobacter butzleri]
MKQNILIIITGTTRGLGKALKTIFRMYTVLSINRKEIDKNDIYIDLSEKDINLEKFNNIIKDYEKIFFISNASIIKPIKNIKDLTNDELDISLYTNFLNQAKIIMQIVKSNKKYLILNITSGAAFTSNTELSLYSSSKAAMHRFIEILKKEEENNPNALYVDNFDPGRMQTEMQKDLITDKKLNINIENLNIVEEVAANIYQILWKYINE